MNTNLTGICTFWQSTALWLKWLQKLTHVISLIWLQLKLSGNKTAFLILLLCFYLPQAQYPLLMCQKSKHSVIKHNIKTAADLFPSFLWFIIFSNIWAILRGLQENRKPVECVYNRPWWERTSRPRSSQLHCGRWLTQFCIVSFAQF